MFTGIIEEVGTVLAASHHARALRLTVKCCKVLEGTRVGDSIAVNGVCLTAASIGRDSFTADVMAETVRRTNLAGLEYKSAVNLERALCIGGRMGGHIVTGHIDGTAQILDFTREKNAVWMTLGADKSILRYIVQKGSVAIDGVSLTVAQVSGAQFKVSLIPHTGSETILLKKPIKSFVNIECDIIGKYVEKLIHHADSRQPSAVDENFLKMHGFI